MRSRAYGRESVGLDVTTNRYLSCRFDRQVGGNWLADMAKFEDRGSYGCTRRARVPRPISLARRLRCFA